MPVGTPPSPPSLIATAQPSQIVASGGYSCKSSLFSRWRKEIDHGNNRGWFAPGRGSGFSHDGARGRRNCGSSRGYGQVDFNNKSEFGNRGSGRGGSLGRGVDGYLRVDHMGNNGGRMNRTGGLTENATKSVAPRVSAPA
ncbi:hypothetical protein HHK36_020235 [Tetracentron sinense]|uniref:Uncharacterized protein n=1 Tax=Tetracentron sinense TaxID=13715 RepID=A0A835D868_TETSI|nr:hypothetical protein HHK36_020235 [Tetracentron sinense]